MMRFPRDKQPHRHPCECENAIHAVLGSKTHRYGMKCYPENLQVVQTKYGAFKVCKECANSCIKELERESATG